MRGQAGHLAPQLVAILSGDQGGEVCAHGPSPGRGARCAKPTGGRADGGRATGRCSLCPAADLWEMRYLSKRLQHYATAADVQKHITA